jgi:hypothetical protein
MLVVAPYFGDLLRLRPLADAWYSAAVRHAGGSQIGFLVPPGSKVATAAAVIECDVHGFADVVRPGQPFDLKGAIVCSFLLRAPETDGILVLDLDAVLARDPREALEPFENAPVAMPIDHGAILYFRTPRLEAPYEHVQKLCAGVMYFGPGNRSRLVAGYKRAWAELRPIEPWGRNLSHLLEQYSWSLCLRRRGGAVLPHTMNWSPRHVGENPAAVVNHDYGLQKWKDAALAPRRA